MVTEVPSESGRIRGASPRARALVILGVLFVFAYWGLIRLDPSSVGAQEIEGAEEALFSPSGSSPALMYGVFALLLYSRLGALKRTLSNPPWIVPGALLVTSAAGLSAWAHYTSAPDLMIPSLILMLLGAGALLGGREGLRVIAIPTVFLVFAYPLPSVCVNQVIAPLQIATAKSATWFLDVIGLDPQRYGDIILVDGKMFQVIETCSGMGMIKTMVMAGALYSVLFYRSRRQVIVIMILAPLIAYAVNWVRVLSIIFNPYSQWGSVHTTQGIVMLVVGVIMIAVLDSLLKRMLHDEPRLVARSEPGPFEWSRVAFFSLLLAALGTANLLIQPWQGVPMRQPVIFGLPPNIAGSAAKGLPIDKQFLGSVGYSGSIHREHEIDGIPVTLFVLSDDRRYRRRSIVSDKTAVPGAGWEEEKRGSVVLEATGAPVEAVEFRRGPVQRLVFHWREGVRTTRSELVRNALALDQSPVRREQWALAVRIDTPILPGLTGRVDAEKRLQRFASALVESLE